MIDSRDAALKNAAMVRLATLIARDFDLPNSKADVGKVQICTKLSFRLDKINRLVGIDCDGKLRWNKPNMMHRFSKQVLEWIDKKRTAHSHDELPYFSLSPKTR